MDRVQYLKAYEHHKRGNEMLLADSQQYSTSFIRQALDQEGIKERMKVSAVST